MENYLDVLNDKQRQAVTTIDGPLLVLAGAGSGKTTVLANRVAYILQNTYANPWNILAITFTNKAANEMKERIEGIVGNAAENMWIGTFHAVCVRILRRCIEREGYTRDFVIYDTADTRTVIKECMSEIGVEERECPVRYTQTVISNAKNHMMSADELRRALSHNAIGAELTEIYRRYIKKLKNNNALDFDDIIMLTVKILKEDEDIAEHYQAQFQYILVDEYQDTNHLQYELVMLLAKGYGNICVVGDDDQSIYRFRGADVENILAFDKDYANAQRIALEQNYRSTSNILNAANGVIANNSKRMGKNLWTDKGEGEKLSLYVGSDEHEEARFIASQTAKRHKKTGRYGDCAVLYRTNAQSRALEEAFMKEAIPYKVLAGLRFYDRKEIKDVIAYLRLIYNPNDDLSLHRIINEPKRKIGKSTLDKLNAIAAKQGVSNFEILKNVSLYDELKPAATRLNRFTSLIKDLRKLATQLTIEQLVLRVIEDSGYMAMLTVENTVESQTRIENIGEFINVVKEYAADETISGSLGEFLESITLMSDIDGYDENGDYVALMTVHSAKGLEFPVVFIAGMEDGIFPASYAGIDAEELEEERRLCYVAITRAKEKLYLTRAVSRFRFGKRVPYNESRFIKEIPKQYIKPAGAAGSRGMQKLENAGIQIVPERREIYSKPKPNTAPAIDGSIFKAGDRVRHRKFGDGTVKQAKAFGKDAILLIDFDTAGTKRLMAAFAKLEIID